MIFMPECSVFIGTEPVGTLRWQEDGPYISIQAGCPFEEGSIYRLTVRGESGPDLYLGVMTPQNGRFTITKRLRSKDCGPLLNSYLCGAYIERSGIDGTPLTPLPFAFSALSTAANAALPGDQLFAEEAGACPGLMWAMLSGRRYFVFEFIPGQEMPMTPFFSLMTVFEHLGRLYAAFCADADGVLRSI